MTSFIIIVAYLATLYAVQSHPELLVRHFSLYVIYRLVSLIVCCQLLDIMLCGAKIFRLMTFIKNSFVFTLDIFAFFMLLLVLPDTVFPCALADGSYSEFSCAIGSLAVVLYYFLKIVAACGVFHGSSGSITVEIVSTIKRHKMLWLAVFLAVAASILCAAFFGPGYLPEFSPPWLVVLQDLILLMVLAYFLSLKLNRK